MKIIKVLKREIKFRAWNTETNDMLDGEELWRWLINAENTGIAEGHLDCEQIPIDQNDYDHLIFMQYTGLLDKKGQEIYEGDILEVYKEFKVIKWDEIIAGFSWRNCSMDNYLMFRKYVAENCVIVGNQFENPELLAGVE